LHRRFVSLGSLTLATQTPNMSPPYATRSARARMRAS